MRAKFSLVFKFILFLFFLHRAHANSDSKSDPYEANIAYFIQVSESTVPLVPRLLRNIWHGRNLYIIHYDKKIPKWQRELATSNLKKFINGKNSNNLRIIESEVITYMGISMVINTMNAMQIAMKSEISWNFFINISGSDYPLVSAKNQRVLLGSSDYITSKRSFFTIAPKHWWSKSFEYRATRLFTDTSIALNGTKSILIDSYCKNPLVGLIGYTFVAAESWMILHRSYVDFILTSPVSRRYFAAFSYISEPEEHFFATVAYNEPRFNDTMVRDAMRQVIWKLDGKKSGQHPYFVDKQTDNGEWMFLPKIRSCGSFFTRKISQQNSQLLDIIDSTVSGVSEKSVDKEAVENYLMKVKKRLRCFHPIREIGLNCRSEWAHR